MHRDQIKWLVIGLAGAFCVLSVFAGTAFFAFSKIPASSFQDEVGLNDEPALAATADEDEPEKVDAPKEWHEAAANWRKRSDAQKPEYERVKTLYERVSPYREIRRRLFNEGDFEYAEAELPVLFAKISDPLAARHYSMTIGKLGEFSFDTKPEVVRETVKKWTEVHPDSHHAWLVRGAMAIDYAWYWRGSGYASTVSEEGWRNFHAAIQEARECLEKAHELEPRNPEPSAQLLVVAKAEGQPRKEIEKYFKRVTAIVPSHWGAHHNRLEYLKPKWSGSWPEYEEALDELKQKTTDPDNPWFLAVYTSVRQDMEYERNPDAKDRAEFQKEWVDVWKACVDRWPDDVGLRGSYLVTLSSVKRYEEAWEQYVWLGNRYPLDIEWDLLRYHHNRIYRLVMHADKLPASERARDFDRIIALDPEFATTYHYIGIARVERGEYEEAESALLRALELGAPGGSTHYALASAYERMGRSDDALRVVQEGKDLNPRDSVAKGLAQIEKRLLDAMGDSLKPIETPASPQ